MSILLVLLVVLVLMFTGLLVLGLLLWWLLSRGSAAKRSPAIEIKMPVEEAVPPPPVEEAVTRATAAEAVAVADVAPEPEEPVAAQDAAEPDDLKRIEGIGPKFSSVLAAAGITTFAQLAAAEVSHIEAILEAESPRLRRLADPSTWPEQAALAAADNWEGLAALQERLKGGRRV